MSLPHYFLALPLPDEVKQHIQTWVGEAKKTHAFKKWVHPQDYHITLFFLGAVETRQLDDVMLKMKGAGDSSLSFSLRVTDSGHFGPAAHPRIFWIGVNRPERLHRLQQNVLNEMVTLGFSEEKRDYKPHITVARKWQGKESYQQKKNAISPITSIEWTASEFVLYRTHLHQEPKYERVETFRLTEE